MLWKWEKAYLVIKPMFALQVILWAFASSHVFHTNSLIITKTPKVTFFLILYIGYEIGIKWNWETNPIRGESCFAIEKFVSTRARTSGLLRLEKQFWFLNFRKKKNLILSFGLVGNVYLICNIFSHLTLYFTIGNEFLIIKI